MHSMYTPHAQKSQISDLIHFGNRDCYPYQSILIIPGPVLSYPIAIGAEGPVHDHVLMVLSLNIVCFCHFWYNLRITCRPQCTAAMATAVRAVRGSTGTISVGRALHL